MAGAPAQIDGAPPARGAEAHGFVQHRGEQQLTRIDESTEWLRGEVIGVSAGVYLGLSGDTGQMMAVGRSGAAKCKWSNSMVLSTKFACSPRAAREHRRLPRAPGTAPRSTSLPSGPDWIHRITSPKFETLQEKMVMNYTVQILRGLDFLHGENIVRDIKCTNVWSTRRHGQAFRL